VCRREAVDSSQIEGKRLTGYRVAGRARVW
jgi:hypothetical protein